MSDMTTKEKDELYKRLGDIDQKISKVFDLLNSDAHTNRPGLVQDVDILKDKVRDLEINRALIKKERSIIGTIAGVVGVLLAWIVEIIYNFLNHR